MSKHEHITFNQSYNTKGFFFNQLHLNKEYSFFI